MFFVVVVEFRRLEVAFICIVNKNNETRNSMKTFISVVFAASTLFFVSTQAQIIEETVIEDEAIVTQNKPDSTEKYSHRFKDPSDCEDACEEDCDKTCESLCGKNESCIDSCEDTCEDNCDIECSKLKLAFGPQKGSVLLFISGNSLIFHNSSISQEEDKYLEETGMHMIYVDKNNNPVDTVRLKYSYISISGAFGIQYYLTEKLGLGVQYEFMQTNQNIDNAYEYSSGALLNTNTISGIVAAHLIQKKRIGLSCMKML